MNRLAPVIPNIRLLRRHCGRPIRRDQTVSIRPTPDRRSGTSERLLLLQAVTEKERKLAHLYPPAPANCFADDAAHGRTYSFRVMLLRRHTTCQWVGLLVFSHITMRCYLVPLQSTQE